MSTVALISSYTPSLMNFRGPLICALRHAGHRVLGYGPEEDRAVQRFLEAEGGEFIRFPIQRASLNPIDDLVTVRALEQSFRHEKPDVVLSYTHKPVVYGSLAAHAAGVPRIYSLITGLGSALIGSNLKSKVAGVFARHLLQSALEVNRRVFLFNRDIEKQFLEQGILKHRSQAVRINGSGVELKAFPRQKAFLKPLTFLLIARLLVDKGIREYVAAARVVKRQAPDTRFRLVGPFDPNTTALSKREVDTWHKEGVIEYCGATDDVRPFLRECSVYVLPSYAEGIPRTVVEAMASGRPIITTDAPGCRETVIDGENGFLVPPRDAESLAQAMLRFLNEPTLIDAMGQRSWELATERFDVENINHIMLHEMELAQTPDQSSHGQESHDQGAQ